MRVCGRAVCGCGSSGGLFAFIEGMCVFCACVCVCVCVCVCLWVCVCRGGQVQGNVCGCGDFVACIGGVGVALRAMSCKNGTKFVQSSHEIRTKFVRNRYEIRANFVRISYEIRPQSTVNTYRECGCYEFRTKFVRNSHELRTNFVRISNNLHEFVSFFSRTNTLSP